MDALLYTLIVFYDGLWRRAKSNTVTVLRWLIVGCVVAGIGCFTVATSASEDTQNIWLLTATALSLAPLVLMLWCVTLVWLEQKN